MRWRRRRSGTGLLIGTFFLASMFLQEQANRIAQIHALFPPRLVFAREWSRVWPFFDSARVVRLLEVGLPRVSMHGRGSRHLPTQSLLCRVPALSSRGLP